MEPLKLAYVLQTTSKLLDEVSGVHLAGRLCEDFYRTYPGYDFSIEIGINYDTYKTHSKNMFAKFVMKDKIVTVTAWAVVEPEAIQ